MQKFYPKDYLFLNTILFCLLTVSHLDVAAQVYPKDTVMLNGRHTNRINLAYLADGYQTSELNLFKTNVNTINASLFNTVPFSQYKNFFNAFAIGVSSNASGAKHPGTASDEGTVPQPILNPDNHFLSTFDTYSIHRLLVPQNDTAIANVLATNLPDYDQVFMVVNSPYYGGSGGTYSTAFHHTSSLLKLQMTNACFFELD